MGQRAAGDGFAAGRHAQGACQPAAGRSEGVLTDAANAPPLSLPGLHWLAAFPISLDSQCHLAAVTAITDLKLLRHAHGLRQLRHTTLDNFNLFFTTIASHDNYVGYAVVIGPTPVSFCTAAIWMISMRRQWLHLTTLVLTFTCQGAQGRFGGRKMKLICTSYVNL